MTMCADDQVMSTILCFQLHVWSMLESDQIGHKYMHKVEAFISLGVSLTIDVGVYVVVF
jgi:hypothetical protein